MVSDHGDSVGAGESAVAGGGRAAEPTGGPPAQATGPDRVWLFVTGGLLLTMPAITLVVAYAALTATRSALLAELTLVEAVELYLVELAAFAVFSYLLYRLTRYTSARHAATLDEREEQEVSADARPEMR